MPKQPKAKKPRATVFVGYMLHPKVIAAVALITKRRKKIAPADKSITMSSVVNGALAAHFDVSMPKR